ncbi:MAG: hypothetical protein RBT68_02475 [Spirochaetia bacterium]|jgi:hypothetical protein|nr:hypothetical protein [Spirochaetia bacterium]
MQRFFACLFFYVLTISSPAAEAAWWSAATAAYGRGLGYEPGHTIVRIEELDPDGMVQSTESGEIRTHRAEGKLVSTVIRAQKNGKDVTADWQKRYNRSSSEGRGGPPAGFDATPFDPAWTSALFPGTPRRTTEGLLIPYTIKRDGVELEGTALFSTDGLAISASQSWLSLPPLVSSMSSTIYYRVLEPASNGDRALVAQGMQIEGMASILFVKKRFRMSFEFGQWRLKPPDS